MEIVLADCRSIVQINTEAHWILHETRMLNFSKRKANIVDDIKEAFWMLWAGKHNLENAT